MVCELHRASIINAHLKCCSNSNAIRPRRLRGVQSLASQIASNSNYQTDTDWSSSVQKVTVRWSLWPSELMIVSNRSWTATRATSLTPRVGAFASCVSPARLKLLSTSHHLLDCLHRPVLNLPAATAVFDVLSDEHLGRLGVPIHLFERLRNIIDANSLDCMTLLQELADAAPNAAGALLSFATGNSATRQTVLDIGAGEAVLLQKFPAAAVEKPDASSEEFITFSDPDGLAHVLEQGTLQQWQLFLHPDQRQLVGRSFSGPARLRGISGSGKTVVALHRVRRLAREAQRTGQRVLFTTFDKGLASAAGRLLDQLCGPERASIEVTHLHRWCLDYVSFRGVPRPRFSPDASREVKGQVVAALPGRAQDVLSAIPRDYLWQEIEFLMGRFLHEDAEGYLVTDRAGRGRALTPEQRRAVLDVYLNYHRRLFDKGFVDPAEFVRIAYRLRRAGEATEAQYAAVVADEVQDLSEIGLRLLHLVVGDQPRRAFAGWRCNAAHLHAWLLA